MMPGQHNVIPESFLFAAGEKKLIRNPVRLSIKHSSNYSSPVGTSDWVPDQLSFVRFAPEEKVFRDDVFCIRFSA